MLKTRPILKRVLISTFTLIVLLIIFVFWFFSLLPSNVDYTSLKSTQAKDLIYLKQSVKESRGKILAVVTSASTMGTSGKSTGYELTELARAYYVFKANGFEVDVASPLGGQPPVVIDGDDMGQYDYAFLNDLNAQDKIKNTLALDKVIPEEYQAIYFVGGKGAMFDFPDNKKIKLIVSEYFQSGKVVGAVCHGPAALVNVKLKNGSPLLANKRVTSFTNEEELLLIPDATEIFPFLLQSKLVEQGATFDAGHLYLEQMVQDGNLITGQNPWSVWAVAESMVKQLGYSPIQRKITAEENTINILNTYQDKGFAQAKAQVKSFMSDPNQSFDRVLLAMHCIVSAMQWNIGDTLDLLRLLAYADND